MSYWYFERGENDNICDVKGVTVGHLTKAEGEIQTGITVIQPIPDNIFKNKCIAAAHVINGFGKPVGIPQINELGTLETPIALTNTLAVGEVTQGLINNMVKENEEIGRDGTVNPAVLECNDGKLNEIRKLSLCKEDVKKAMDLCSDTFEQGAVGAGRGMVCYNLKGGIGSASRKIHMDDVVYTVGVLVLTNFGSMRDLIVQDRRMGPELVKLSGEKTGEDKGSIIVILGTDIPLSHRQLLRMAKRAQSGIARTGGYTGNGSGEIALAFSTAQQIPSEKTQTLNLKFIHDSRMDPVFQATVEAVEESILQSLLHAETVTGVQGRTVYSLKHYFPDLELK